MFSKGTQVFIQTGEEVAKRILHPATVVEQAEHITAELEDDMMLEPGQDVFVYHEISREFMKQTAHVEAVMIGEAGQAIIGFQTTSDPVSAESRQFCRVTTVTSGINATFGPEEGCPVTDVSVKGFSLIAEQPHVIGERVPTTINYLGQRIAGTGSVQSIKDLGDGRVRYGLLSTKEAGRGDALQQGLHRMTMELQRQQLRRLAGGE
jgi:hypothetical protein